jgi:hypothetical protein
MLFQTCLIGTLVAVASAAVATTIHSEPPFSPFGVSCGTRARVRWLGTGTRAARPWVAVCGSASRCVAVMRRPPTKRDQTFALSQILWTSNSGKTWERSRVSVPIKNRYILAASCSTGRACVALGSDRYKETGFVTLNSSF